MGDSSRAEIVIVGGGIAGIVAGLELLGSGHRVCILDRDDEANFGGLAKEAFGGMALCGTPLQRLNGIKDNPQLMLRDWLSFADFSDLDHWPRYWAESYCFRNQEDVYQWLKMQGVRFFPAVNWVERGEFVPGNSVPRYHIVWGTGWELVRVLLDRLLSHKNRSNLRLCFQHRVETLLSSSQKITGVQGVNEITGESFQIDADLVIVASGGINGDLERVRQNWPAGWGTAPATLLNGSHRYADGTLHDAAQQIGASVTHLDWQWNYAAGIHHPAPRMPLQGLSLIPPRSALWMDATGRRVGPHPLVTGFDTHGICQRICNMPHGYTWQVMNRKIAHKEISISGSEHNPALRDKRPVKFLKEILLGNDNLYDYLVNQCPDVIQANSLEELGARMDAMDPDVKLDVDGMVKDVRDYDNNIERGSAFHNDDQLRRIEHLRHWKGDKARTLKHQKIEDAHAFPLLAIREFIISRKSMGGIQTDNHCRVLNTAGEPITNLYAVGEAAGFGGGGANGKRSLEGTFLSLCVLTGRVAAGSIAGKSNP